MPEIRKRLDELQLIWDEAREEGRQISLEELCRDCPELLPSLRDRVAAQQEMEDWLDDSASTSLDRLLEDARMADSDPWRKKFGVSDVLENTKRLIEATRVAPVKRFSPSFVLLVARFLKWRRPESREWLLKGLAFHRDDFWLNFDVGNVLVVQREFAKAQSYYHTSLALRKDTAAVYYNWGVALSHLGEADDAIAKYRECIRVNSKNAYAYSNWGEALAQMDQYQAAIAKFAKAAQLAPNLPTAHHNWGFALVKLGKYDEAISHYKRTLAIRENYPDAHNDWGYALIQNGDFDGAISKFKGAIRINKQDAVAYSNWGFALVEKGAFDAAIAKCQKALELQRDYAPAENTWGLALMGKRDFAGAIAHFKLALDLNPKYAGAHNGWGRVLVRKGEFDRAIEHYRQALAIDPSDAYARAHWGFALNQKGDYDSAISQFEMAAKLNPYLPSIYDNWGLSLAAKQDWLGAVAKHKKAIDVSPLRKNAYLHLGIAFVRIGDQDAAIKTYAELVEIAPHYAKAHYNWGYSLYQKQDFPAAVGRIRKAIAIDPRYALAYCFLGRALQKDGQFREAVEALERGHELGSQTPGWRRPSDKWLQESKLYFKLDKELPEVLSGAKKPSTLSQWQLYVVTCHWKKHYVSAADILRKAIAQIPILQKIDGNGYRYNEAKYLIWAASGKSRDVKNPDAEQRSNYRRRALDLLHCNLRQWRTVLDKNPQEALTALDILQSYRSKGEFTDILDSVALKQLPRADKKAIEEFWQQADVLIQANLEQTEATKFQGKLTDKTTQIGHDFKMEAGQSYLIDMISSEFDAYLAVISPDKKLAAKNDDGGDGLNSQLLYKAKKTGVHRIVATSFRNIGRGEYELIVRRYIGK